jgi:adenosylcobinamide kinase/adenosylcobinamide-phosphate guanylyltransferase
MIVLVTGGARSGKSSFAEKYVAKYGKRIAYIATAQIFDEEMKFRVDLHQSRRPSEWQTYEAPFDAHKAILEAGEKHDMILFDCMTIYTSNLLFSLSDIDDSKKNYELIREKFSQLIEAAKSIKGTVVFVTNEVGCGIVPDNHLSREYRDLAGLANQLVAEVADKVYLVVSGIPVDIKKISEVLDSGENN